MTAPPPDYWRGASSGNSELRLYLLVELVFVLVWAIDDFFEGLEFVLATTALTSAYLISRGIAKASRVYEL